MGKEQLPQLSAAECQRLIGQAFKLQRFITLHPENERLMAPSFQS
jgi:hypothetical protein